MKGNTTSKPNTLELEQFVRKAMESCYLGSFTRAKQTERPGFFEMEYLNGDWEYRDSFTGMYVSSGQEVVRFQGIPVWSSSYGGGIAEKYFGKKDFFKEVEDFLRKALSNTGTGSFSPRGPKSYSEGDWTYNCEWSGNVSAFSGYETITNQGEEVFSHRFFGGVVIGK